MLVALLFTEVASRLRPSDSLLTLVAAAIGVIAIAGAILISEGAASGFV